LTKIRDAPNAVSGGVYTNEAALAVRIAARSANFPIL
jgi:hypothetical protein